MKIVFVGLSYLPWGFHYAFSNLLYGLLYYVVRYRRNVVRDNLQHAFPEKSLQDIKRIERGFYHNLCDLFVEVVKLFHTSPEQVKKHLVFKNMETFRAALRTGRSQFLVIAHHGNWEFIPSIVLHIPAEEAHIIQLYKQLTNASFDALMKNLREQFGSKSVESRQALRTLATAKQTKQTLAIGFLIDQSPLPGSLHYWTDFLHRKTAFIDSAERMARRLEYGMFYCDMRKVSRGCYEAELIPMAENVAETAPYAMTELYARLLEQSIRRQPECYLWSHNRWKYSGLYPGDTKNEISTR